MSLSSLKPWKLAKRTFAAWSHDGALQLGAALAYYAVFSLSPLLIIAFSVAGFFYKDYGFAYIYAQVAEVTGTGVADTVTSAIKSVHSFKHSVIAAVVATTVVFIGASGFFVQLQSSLNQIWDVRPKAGHFCKDFLKERLFSFGMILGVCFVLIVSLAINTGLSIGGEYLGRLLPRADWVKEVLNSSVSFAIVFFLFAAIFKIVPNSHIGLDSVCIGALLTAVLFRVGQFAVSWYLARSGVGSTFGAAGSMLVVLAWVYYSSQILLLGAEFTKIYAVQSR